MQLSSMSKKMAWGILAMALLVPAAAQAAGARPDDRAGVRGADPAVVASVRPDDRAGVRGAGPTVVAAVRPDDRAGIRGIGTNSATNLVYRPETTLVVGSDERVLERGTGTAAPAVVDSYQRSHASPTVSSSQSSVWIDRSAWYNAAIAAAIALATISIAVAALHLIRRPAHAH